MKVFLVLLVVLLALAFRANAQRKVCELAMGIPVVKSFGGRNMPVKMPCKYHAVRQKCGKYEINITPANIYVANKYYVNTLWVGLLNPKTGDTWEGRTSNKRSVKVLNGQSDVLFIKKTGSLKTHKVLTFSKDGRHTYASNPDFRITFTPWDPDQRDLYGESKWSFECLSSDTFTPAGYPQQVCGEYSNKAFRERRETFGQLVNMNKLTSAQMIMLDVFTESHVDVAQVDPKCEMASTVMKTTCTSDTARATAIVACSQILIKGKLRKCTTKYSCDPMDVFVDCLKWACSDFTDKTACQGLASGMDLCREFKEGNLTGKVRASGCYNDYLRIDPEED